MMTAGQGGGQYGQPTGQPGQNDQPQGWNAPPGPPLHGQQYPGYTSAPSPPTGHGAPAPLERPVTVRAGIGAFVGGIVLSVVAQVVTMLNWDTVMDAQLGDLSEDEAVVMAGMSDSLGVFGLIFGLVFTGVFALFVWFAWRGHNWARIVLWVLAGLGLAFGLMGLGLGSAMPVLTALGVFELVFDAAAIVLLALKPSNEWFRFRSWQRATRQG